MLGKNEKPKVTFRNKHPSLDQRVGGYKFLSFSVKIKISTFYFTQLQTFNRSFKIFPVTVNFSKDPTLRLVMPTNSIPEIF